MRRIICRPRLETNVNGDAFDANHGMNTENLPSASVGAFFPSDIARLLGVVKDIRAAKVDIRSREMDFHINVVSRGTRIHI